MTTTEVLLSGHLLVSTTGFCVLVVFLRRIERGERQLGEGINALRLTGRTRQATASVQSGAPSEVQELRRLGRVSANSRVVVGGDSDSPQHQKLERQFVKAGDNDE